ncbi:MAG TPA: glycogen synthase GlgA [Vicinamibacteria bacterium]|nr:glycogen synthase GlgA [Vicinamibacteria bacterium]
MKIAFVTSELAGFAKVGGLADVAASLPRAIARLGHDVFVFVPLYRKIDGLRLVLDNPHPLWHASLHGIPTYFLESPKYFSGRSVYGDEAGDYADNAFRFAFFSRAVLETVEAAGLEPDVVHVNDWPTALAPVFTRGRLPMVLTIHNLAYQGVFPREWLDALGLPRELFHIDGLEFHGKINFLKGGLMTADALTTVSPAYAREIQAPELGAGLDGVMRLRSKELVGILNGIEPSEWDPESDPALVARYSSRRLEGKHENKVAVQKELGLEATAEAPLLGIVGRLDRQKGFDLLLEATPTLMAEGAQLAVLGSGSSETLRRFRALAESYPGALAAEPGFNDELGRRIYAGADFFLMPSRYEPCGIGQMIALRYGTLPVVRETGGLRDTIRDLDADPRAGNGFVFHDFSADDLLSAVRRAIRLFEDRGRLRHVVARAMRQDFSWKASALRYEEVYERITRRRPTDAPADRL